MMDINPSSKYHLIGIGGDGMSALAHVLLQMGADVVGSDIEENEHGQILRAAGAKVHVGHDGDNLDPDTDAVIISSAIPSHNSEIREAKNRGVPVNKRLTALAGLMERQKGIGIAGTHGKSTTTTMTATLLQFGGYDPTYMIGADCKQLGGNSKLGSGDYFVSEVDESDGHFLKLRPEIGLVTNVGRDHLNTYKDEKEIVEVFSKFLARSERGVVCVDGAHSEELLAETARPFTFGIRDKADLKADNITQQGFETSFDVSLRGNFKGRLKLPAPGKHNVYNALGAMSIGHMVGMDFDQMTDILQGFELPNRRFQILRNNGHVIIDDYAHLPEEIEVTLEAIKEGWDPDRVVAVFQPHRFSRTKHINGQFGDSFKFADTVVVTDIYPACERPIPGVTSELIVNSIKKKKSRGVHRILNREKLYSFLVQNVEKGDFVVGLGAGDIWKTTKKLAER